MKVIRIAVLATAGTIAAEAGTAAEVLCYRDSRITAAELLEPLRPHLPAHVELTPVQLQREGSENFTPETWLALAHAMLDLEATGEVDGFVLLQGTDTLEETAYFLQLALPFDKPVVLAGAMRPASALSADGPLNLLRAVQLAASQAGTDGLGGLGVLVLANERIFAAREVTKTHASSIDSLGSPEFGCLGYLNDDRPRLHRRPIRAARLPAPFDVARLGRLPKVDIAYAFAGAGAEAIQAFVAAGAQGIVHAGTGNGSISRLHQDAYRAAIAQGVAVVRSSRTGGGIVFRNGAVDDDQLGSVSADSLNPQKARVLLTLGLTITRDAAALQQLFDRY